VVSKIERVREKPAGKLCQERHHSTGHDCAHGEDRETHARKRPSTLNLHGLVIPDAIRSVDGRHCRAAFANRTANVANRVHVPAFWATTMNIPEGVVKNRRPGLKAATGFGWQCADKVLYLFDILSVPARGYRWRQTLNDRPSQFAFHRLLVCFTAGNQHHR
jgi:hypothetical protein